MRIAFLNRERTWPGGDLVALDATMLALRRRGVECCEGVHGLKHADLIHIFHCTFPWSRENFRAAAEAGKPYVVTPIFYPDGLEIGPAELAVHLKRATAVLPFSITEGEEMCAWLGEHIPYTPIPNGTDPAFHAFPLGGFSRVGVCASNPRASGGKQEEKIAAACQAAAIPFTLIRGYDYDKMPSQYSRYRVFVSASTTERMSLAIGEALCVGCRVLATMANRGNEWYGPGLAKIDPCGSPEYFRLRIHTAYHAPSWDWTSNNKARQLTWDGAAEKLMKVYLEALA
jgi:glycosyltransferase involved in cell wall biosynthesis